MVAARHVELRPSQAVAIPLVFTAALASMATIPSVAESPPLVESLLGAAGALFAWAAIWFVHARARHRMLGLEVVLRPQHYVQACAQLSVFLYWGYYWPEVYRSAPLLVAQLLFAFAFDMLLGWSRRSSYTLGLGPLPVILSINLFLWFKPDWFYLQLVMVAAGFTAKEVIAWEKDGRRAHVFNPSSFPLAVASVLLIATGTSGLTWGPEIATTLDLAPHMYAFFFAIGLVGQYFFGVTTMTASAAVSMYALGRLYFAATGVHFFRGEYIPIAVFLGMHLLFTDPSTSPRTELARLFYGMLYAAGVMLFYGLLDRAGEASFYDKLLPVPILNLTIRAIDRAARSGTLARFDPASVGRALTPRRRHLAYIGIWTAAFVALGAAHALGPYAEEASLAPK